MKYTVLGRSEISVSRISMGTHHLNDPADMDKHVQNFLYAYKKGINFFETSVTYGEGYSELILGEAVKEMKKEGRPFFIMSKNMQESKHLDGIWKFPETAWCGQHRCVYLPLGR